MVLDSARLLVVATKLSSNAIKTGDDSAIVLELEVLILFARSKGIYDSIGEPPIASLSVFSSRNTKRVLS